MALAVAIAVWGAATADAAYYKSVLCAANNGSNAFEVRTNSPGLFSVENYCGPAPDPAGNSAFLRIYEQQGGGGVSNTAYAQASWTVPPWVSIKAAGGYTRIPGEFRDGWRGRFWGEGFDGSAPHNFLMQGTGAENAGISWAPTSTFGSHNWPFPSFGDYKRFVFELTCMRPAGCDTSGWNAVEANTFSLILSDDWPSQVRLTNADGALMAGQWVRGERTASMVWTELGSGMRMERFRIDGREGWVVDHQAAGQCNLGYSQANGEFARVFQPCATASDIGRTYGFNSANWPDGSHTLEACTQDYAQSVSLFGSRSESCDSRTIRTDNSPPGAPAGLEVTSANPARYLSRFGAKFALPPNNGSPITRVYYQVTTAAGEAIGPVQSYAAANPTEVPAIAGPAKAGDYRLRVWLEDEVGFTGPASVAQVPHDTTPPAAPQDLTATGPTSWGPAQGYRLRWRDVVDNGSPIVAAHYQVVDKAGKVVEPTRTVDGENVQALADLETPKQTGNYDVRVWLEDEEGNVGAAANSPLPRDTTPPAAPQGLSVTAPGVSKAEQGFDVRWQNVVDDGSPIVAAHYQVLNGAGQVVVATKTTTAAKIDVLQDLEAPKQSGRYQLRLWLQDAEGNVGVSSTAPLAYECVRSDASGGTGLSSGMGEKAVPEETVNQGTGSTLRGKLTGPGGGIGDASVCVFGRVVTHGDREFLGVAMTGSDGRFQFAVPAGPSRELSTVYRSGTREVTSRATTKTVVHPTFKAQRKVVRNKGIATFTGWIPGPDNDDVVVVLQVKRGKGWLAFRRYRTRSDGQFTVIYRFNKTNAATKYRMRAQVRAQSGYAYEEGNSAPLTLVVLPQGARRR